MGEFPGPWLTHLAPGRPRSVLLRVSKTAPRPNSRPLHAPISPDEKDIRRQIESRLRAEMEEKLEKEIAEMKKTAEEQAAKQAREMTAPVTHKSDAM
jgi:tRNA A37 N6-isopentenylltransferase MiaA